MRISDIKIRKIINESKLRAILSVTFDDALAVHDIKIIDGGDRLFVAMPSRKNKLGEYKDIIHPINKKMRDELSEVLIKAYQEELLRSPEGMQEETEENEEVYE